MIRSIEKHGHSVTFHRDGYETPFPAVNVKCYSFGRGVKAEDFGCSEKELERAMELAWEAACERFWEVAQDNALEILGQGVAVYSQGRSGGWLVVDGLDDPAEWDEEMFEKWEEFREWCEAEIKYAASDEAVREDIRANEWHKLGSQLYNMIDDPETGKPISLPDLQERERRYIKAAPAMIKALKAAATAMSRADIRMRDQETAEALPLVRAALKEVEDVPSN